MPAKCPDWVNCSRNTQPRIWSALHRIADMNTRNVRLPHESGPELAMCWMAEKSQLQTFDLSILEDRYQFARNSLAASKYAWLAE